MKKTLEEAAENYRVVDCGADKTERYLEKAFIAGANYQKSITPFSEEDMIGFAEWIKNLEYLDGTEAQNEYSPKELLSLYLKQKK